LAPSEGPLVDELEGERRSEGKARIAVGIYQLLLAFGASLTFARASYWRRFFHSFRLLFQGPGRQQLVLPQGPNQLYSLVELVEVAAAVFYFIWQYRSAIVARRLGYPARRSPGWGIGAWFVPVVNLWMPYQAVRDLLPPGHPDRRRVLAAWLLWLLSVPLSAVMVVGAELSTPLRIVLLAVDLVDILGLAGLAWSIIVTTTETHEAELARRRDQMASSQPGLDAETGDRGIPS
jgi:hypothetical protein